jgi:hypothetical protein
MTDEFDQIDKIADAAGTDVDALLPFEPSVEVREETDHEEPVDAETEIEAVLPSLNEILGDDS